MKKTRVAIAMTIACASPLYALDLTKWGTSGDWVILRDPNHGNGCLALHGHQQGNQGARRVA